LNWSKSKTIGVNGTFAFEYRITDWLNFESNNNISYRFNRSEEYTDPSAIGAEGYHGAIYNSVDLTTTRYTNQLVRFNKVFDNKHAVSAFLGYEFSDYFYESTEATGSSIPTGKEILKVAAYPSYVGGMKSGNVMQSVYFNANYTFDNRYNAQFSFRRDGSSKYAPGSRYGNFWTIGAGWSIDKEEFMSDVKWVDYLKLRGSYGLIGSTSSLNDYDWMTLNTLTLAYNGIKSPFPDQLGNNTLAWENSYEANVALETRLFDRVSLVVDWYDKNTSGLLYRTNLASVSGYTYQYQNMGGIKNTGFEITLSPDLIMTKDWAWTMTLIYGMNRNKVMELINDNSDQVMGNYIFRVGYDRDSFYLPEWAGVDIYTGQPLWYRVDDSGNKSLVTNIADATRVINGSSTPKGYGSIQTSLSYKKLTLSAMGNFVWGNKVFHYARQFYDNDGAYPTFNSVSLSSGPNWNRWEKPGDIATHPQAIWGGNNNSNQASTRYLEDGSYFRLVNVQLSYDLPARWLKKLKLSTGQVYVSGENLFTLTKFSGADIEVGVGSDNGISGLDVYPSARRVIFGINLSF
jgi:TonB-linked SusC/RagA family outer membrane protein